MAELRRHFRPEFLNRVDEIVLFKPLTLPEIERVVDLLIVDLQRRLADRRLELKLTEAARRHIASEGFDPIYGARPLRRFLQREVETRIGRALLTGNIPDGSTTIVDAPRRSPDGYLDPRRGGRTGRHRHRLRAHVECGNDLVRCLRRE